MPLVFKFELIGVGLPEFRASLHDSFIRQNAPTRSYDLLDLAEVEREMEREQPQWLMIASGKQDSFSCYRVYQIFPLLQSFLASLTILGEAVYLIAHLLCSYKNRYIFWANGMIR